MVFSLFTWFVTLTFVSPSFVIFLIILELVASCGVSSFPASFVYAIAEVLPLKRIFVLYQVSAEALLYIVAYSPPLLLPYFVLMFVPS